jgi:hypothetical protein
MFCLDSLTDITFGDAVGCSSLGQQVLQYGFTVFYTLFIVAESLLNGEAFHQT